MIETEIDSALHATVGFWPSPPLTQEEGLALRHILHPYDMTEFEAAVDLLSAEPRQFRPGPTVIQGALRSVRQHMVELRASKALPPGEPCTPDRQAYWVEQCRIVLANSKGPLAKGMGHMYAQGQK